MLSFPSPFSFPLVSFHGYRENTFRSFDAARDSSNIFDESLRTCEDNSAATLIRVRKLSCIRWLHWITRRVAGD